MTIGIESYGAIPSAGSATATAATAFTLFVPPWRGAAGKPAYVLKADGQGKWQPKPHAFTHIEQLVYTPGGTAHSVVVMRPLNWTWITTAVAANSTSVVLYDDPGTFSTNYRYDLPGTVTKPAGVADNAIAASDYVAFQLKDGAWHVSAVTSVSSLTLTLTTATPNVTGGGADANTVLFYFGAAADKDPATALAHTSFTTPASGRTSLLPGIPQATISNLRPGDPMLIYSANGTAAGSIDVMAGFYANR